ncbi:hypothetical protein N9L01_00375 [bacterium]|nr:hypothetical protein [bacterium]
MLRHSIYSVRDKKKVDAEVIDIREIESAKGVRFQIVGIHPEDGTTVTTFCSALVADDYRQKLDAIPQEMSAENVVLAQDHIPKSEATVVSTDGTPVEDDLETFVEDPLVGSPSEGTLTSAKVMAAEGESEKKNCGCGQDPCKTYGAEGVSTTTLEDLPKDSLLDILGSVSKLTAVEEPDVLDDYDDVEVFIVGDFIQDFVDAANKKQDKSAETVAGIDIQTPSQIAIETPDSDELIVPDPDHLVSGDGRVLGQQTGKVNTTPMHAEGDDVDDEEQIKLFYEGIYTNDDEDDPREGQEIKSYSLVSARDYQEYYEDTKLNPCACDEQGCLSCFLEEYPHTPEIKNGSIPSYSSLWFESDSVFEAPITQPSFAGNKRVLIPTAVIGGLALAYLAKPELLSGSFDKISEMLGKLTKKDDKTE